MESERLKFISNQLAEMWDKSKDADDMLGVIRLCEEMNLPAEFHNYSKMFEQEKPIHYRAWRDKRNLDIAEELANQ